MDAAEGVREARGEEREEIKKNGGGGRGNAGAISRGGRAGEIMARAGEREFTFASMVWTKGEGRGWKGRGGLA